MTATPNLDRPDFPAGRTTQTTRQESVGKPGLPGRTLQPCGTYAAAMRHKARGEPIDEACMEARREWWREQARLIRSIPPLRERKNAHQREWYHRQRQDEVGRRRDNAADRARRRRLKASYIDAVKVERACQGQPVTLSRNERLEAVRRMRARNHSYDDIARRLGVAQRQVHRDLTDLGLVGEAG